jgi:ABC-type sugar transport system permease subunit
MKPSKQMIVLFLAPALLFYFVIFFYPTLHTIYLSFLGVSSFLGSDAVFRGLRNYTELFRTPLFQESFGNIAKIWLLGGLGIFGLAFLFTVLLTSGIRGKSFFRAVIYLPNIISVVALTTMWTQYIYSPRFGLFKSLFEALGLKALAEFQWTTPDHLFPSMLIAYVWGGVGWFMLIILAGVERIPFDLYEAARLDGAGLAQTFFQITLPLLRDVIRITVVMWSITVINLFAFPRTFTPVVQQTQTYTPAIYLYDLAFGANVQSTAATDIGKAAAAAVSLLILVIIAAALINWLIKRDALEY